MKGFVDIFQGVDSDLFPPLTDSENESIEQFEKRLLEAEALGLDEIRMKSREKQVLLHKKQRDNRDSIEKRKQKAYKKVH